MKDKHGKPLKKGDKVLYSIPSSQGGEIRLTGEVSGGGPGYIHVPSIQIPGYHELIADKDVEKVTENDVEKKVFPWRLIAIAAIIALILCIFLLFVIHVL